MTIDYAATNAALYARATTDSAGAALRALLGTFPTPFPLNPALAGQPAIFSRPLLRTYAGSGVRFPWLIWAAADVPGDSHSMLTVGGSWWAYVQLGASEPRLLNIRSALDALYSSTPLAISGGRLGVTHRGRAIDDAALAATGMETRIGYTRLG